MNRYFHTLLYTLLFFPLASNAEGIAEADSASIVSEADSTIIEAKPAPTGFNSLDYLMEKRFQKQGETFKKRWYDHTFLEVGLDMENVMPPMSDYKFIPISMGRLAVGKQFDKYNSLRVGATAGFTYQKGPEFYMMKVGGRLEHLFDVSSYVQGYKPTRFFNVSTIIGGGAMFSRFVTDYGFASARGTAVEGHAGLQFKFVTGPQSALNIEPYIGIGSDVLDASESRNWRKYDGFYGANITYTYYFNNNYTPEARKRIIENRRRKEELTSDSLLFSWRKPFFIEMYNSAKASKKGLNDLSNHVDFGYGLSIGKWFSPSSGVRVTVASENATNRKELYAITNGNTKNANDDTYFPISNYKFARVEALFNPLGLDPYYNWDAKAGFYGLVGLQMGYISQDWERYDWMRKRTQGFTAGLHLWVKLSKDLQFFVEPRLEHNTYHIPDWHTETNHRYNDDLATISWGVTVNTCPKKYVYWDKTKAYTEFYNLKHITVGGSLGVNNFQKKHHYGSSVSLGWNIQGFGEYHFNDYHSVRASLEYIDYPSNYMRGGTMKDLNHEAFAVSANYMLNLANVFSPSHAGRRAFEYYIFAGPAMIIGVNNAYVQSPRLTANFGAKLLYRINDYIGIHITPTFYKMSTKEMDYIFTTARVHDLQLYETFNAGVQFSF